MTKKAATQTCVVGMAITANSVLPDPTPTAPPLDCADLCRIWSADEAAALHHLSHLTPPQLRAQAYAYASYLNDVHFLSWRGDDLLVCWAEALTQTIALSRDQQRAYGLLIDVSPIGWSIGFPWPVAIDIHLWRDIEAIPDSLRGIQRLDGRVWDVVHGAFRAVVRALLADTLHMVVPCTVVLPLQYTSLYQAFVIVAQEDGQRTVTIRKTQDPLLTTPPPPPLDLELVEDYGNIVQQLREQGYAPHAPNVQTARWDGAIATGCRCATCHVQLAYRPWSKGYGYMPYLVCPICTRAIAF